jgi:hypothetical protein
MTSGWLKAPFATQQTTLIAILKPYWTRTRSYSEVRRGNVNFCHCNVEDFNRCIKTCRLGTKGALMTMKQVVLVWVAAASRHHVATGRTVGASSRTDRRSFGAVQRGKSPSTVIFTVRSGSIEGHVFGRTAHDPSRGGCGGWVFKAEDTRRNSQSQAFVETTEKRMP